MKRMMKSGDDSRRRPILIIAFTILVGLSLGYMYSYSRSNRLLLNKHAALSFNYKTCKGLVEKCDSNLNKCITSGEQLHESKNNLDAALQTQKKYLTSVQSNLEAVTNKFSIAYQFYLDVGIITGISPTKSDSNDDEKGLTPEMVNSIKEEITRLKKGKADYDELKTRYTTLKGNYTKLAMIKDSLSQRSKEMEDSKNTVEKEVENLKMEKSSVDMVNAKLTKRINDNFLKETQSIKTALVDEEKSEHEISRNVNLDGGQTINLTSEVSKQGTSIPNVTKQDQIKEVKELVERDIAGSNRNDQNTNAVSTDQDNMKPTDNANVQANQQSGGALQQNNPEGNKTRENVIQI